MSNNVYKKSRSYAPERFFECEGRGLNWLREAYDYGGPKVAKVFDWGKDYLNTVSYTHLTLPTTPYV